jgi:hypothetical protein
MAKRRPIKVIPPLSEEQRARFWLQVRRDCPSGCWEWQGHRAAGGYGQAKIGGCKYRAHRVAYWLWSGQQPALVMHSCDNPPCCNPRHLHEGDYVKNALDMVNKDRDNNPRGEEHHSSKLSNQQVREIFVATRPYSELAEQYAVSEAQVRSIKKLKTRAWAALGVEPQGPVEIPTDIWSRPAAGWPMSGGGDVRLSLHRNDLQDRARFVGSAPSPFSAAAVGGRIEGFEYSSSR